LRLKIESITRFLKPPKQSFFLFGPRGTGKSTWLKNHFPTHTLYLDLLKPDIFRQLTASPERLSELIAGQKNLQTVILDEIQKAPGLLDVVHSLMEDNKKIRFILTGSSARKWNEPVWISWRVGH